MKLGLIAFAAAVLAVASASRAQEATDRVSYLRGDEAKRVFTEMKKLAGKWEGKSTKDWTERIEYDLIAGGSVIMDRSFGAHPNEWMATMIYMDGDRLLLTHYCIAKNQPRLVATRFEGKEITFEFLDATNLKSRDQGHMDKVVYKLAGPDRFTSRWTWYQDGKERWMEEVEHRRTPRQLATGCTSKVSTTLRSSCCVTDPTVESHRRMQ